MTLKKFLNLAIKVLWVASTLVSLKAFSEDNLLKKNVGQPNAVAQNSVPGSAEQPESGKSSLDPSVTPQGNSGNQADDSVIKGQEEAEKAVMEGLEKKSLAFGFAKNKSGLTSDEKRDIKALLDAQDNTSYRAYVAAWADVEKVELSKKSNASLAKKRVAEIQRYLKTIGFKGKIVGVNMVSESGALAKAFGTESSKVKGAMENSKNDVDLRHHRIAEVIKAKGGKSKAVLILAE